jgi:hypothetical protein
MDVEAELRRVAKLLETEIHVAGSSKRAVERKLNVAAGYLTKVVKGGIEFRLRHILEVAEVTGFDVAEFFRKAFPLEPGTEAGGGPAAWNEDELEARIDRAVARHVAPLLAELAEIRRGLATPETEPERRSGADPGSAPHPIRRPG